MVFRNRIEDARRKKESADRKVASMDVEISRASDDMKRAELAKHRSDEFLSKELGYKRDISTELKDVQRQMQSDTERAESARVRIGQLQAEGAREQIGDPQKDELLQKLEELQAITAETDQLTLQLRRRNAAAAQ
jgi:hypothetical protein